MKDRINEFTVTCHYSNNESLVFRKPVFLVTLHCCNLLELSNILFFFFFVLFFENFMFECYLKQHFSIVWAFFGINKNSIDP